MAEMKLRKSTLEISIVSFMEICKATRKERIVRRRFPEALNMLVNNLVNGGTRSDKTVLEQQTLHTIIP